MNRRLVSTMIVTSLAMATFLSYGIQGSAADADEKPEKLVLLMSSEGTAPMEKAIDIFEEETGIKIELMSEAYDNMHNKIMTMVAGGSQLDLISLDTVWPAEFANSNLIVPLDDLSLIHI